MSFLERAVMGLAMPSDANRPTERSCHFMMSVKARCWVFYKVSGCLSTVVWFSLCSGLYYHGNLVFLLEVGATVLYQRLEGDLQLP
jgi:hypothetical protein